MFSLHLHKIKQKQANSV